MQKKHFLLHFFNTKKAFFIIEKIFKMPNVKKSIPGDVAGQPARELGAGRLGPPRVHLQNLRRYSSDPTRPRALFNGRVRSDLKRFKICLLKRQILKTVFCFLKTFQIGPNPFGVLFNNQVWSDWKLFKICLLKKLFS